MKKLLVSLSSIALVTVVFATIGGAEASAPPLKFGMDANAMAAQDAAGVAADYGTFWIGPWTLSSGWAGPDAQMAKMKAAGVTPAIHFYYWGDDISPSCVENGCWSNLHKAQKTRAGWQELGRQFAQHMNSQMQGAPVVVFLESEFNKGGIENYEPFDGYMAEMAKYLHQQYPAAQIVLGFGNWGSHAWGNFDRAAAESDLIGLQGMRGSTRDSFTAYMTLYEATLSGAKKLQGLFGKPILITDVALSSYPEPEYLDHQANSLKKFFDNLAELKGAGVMGIIYRSWSDSPNMDLANYYGQAERHWGFVRASSMGGAAKPSMQVWVDGVKAERAHASSPTTTTSSNVQSPTQAPTTTSSAPFSASFKPSATINEWWVEVVVSSSSEPAKVEAQANGGAWQQLTKQSWGAWAKSFHAPKGSSMVFRATSASGETVTSEPIQWMGAPFTASFQPTNGINEWWIDVKVTSSAAPVKVEARANEGVWHSLSKTSYGTWAKSFHAPKGSSMVFRATSSSGETATSAPIQWLGAPATTTSAPATSTSAPATTTTAAPTTSSAPAFTARFEPASGSNEWWVEVKVTSSSAPAKVEAQVNGGAWQQLTKQSWGNWAKSFHAPKGSSMVFRATSASGEVATSAPMQWLGAPAPTTSSAPAFTATFAPKGTTNNWWVEVSVSGSSPITKVEARENGGPWIELSKTSWGTYAKSFHVENGHRIEFRATSSTGATAMSGAYTWS